jgi:hypothetical protein
MIKNGQKQVFDNTYLHDFLSYTQVCSMEPTSDVQLSYGITQGANYTQNPI